jgi:hypothetical protein
MTGVIFMSNQEKLTVTVRYIAATKPFQDNDVSRQETLGSLKTRVMDAFGVKESQDSNQQVLYWLYEDETKLEDLSRTLGAIVGEKSHLKLRLVQQIIQG